MPIRSERPLRGPAPRKQPQGPRSDREENQYHPDELGKPFDDTPSNAPELVALQARFDRELKGRFDLVRSGFWKSGIPGAEGLIITPAKDARGETRAISITPVHTDEQGKPILRMPTLQLSKNGQLIGEIPEEIDDSLFREQIIRATLDVLKMLEVHKHPAFESNIPILGGTAEKDGDGDGEWVGITHVRDPRRVAFLQKQEGALFMFVQTQQGMPVGQHVYVFETFLYVDSEFTEYAAYFFDLTEPLTLTREDLPDPRIPGAFDAWVVQQPWFSTHLRQTRQQARDKGAERKFHSGDWEQRIQQEIDKRKKPRQSP